MNNRSWISSSLSLVFFVAIFACLIPGTASAYPSLWDNRCASCHSDDTASCNACHEHHGNISAEADQATYDPGAIVTVTLDGGSRGGWVRGLLYNQGGTEIDRASGPTGTGDDGAGDPVVFPITLQATAPSAPGQYTWSAAWFGAPNSGGGAHTEDSTPVTITVEAASAVPDEGPPVTAWGQVKALYR